MKKEQMKRLLGLARECEMKGWVCMVEAGAGLAVPAANDALAEQNARRAAADAAVHFRDAARLLGEVAGDGDGGL